MLPRDRRPVDHRRRGGVVVDRSAVAGRVAAETAAADGQLGRVVDGSAVGGVVADEVGLHRVERPLVVVDTAAVVDGRVVLDRVLVQGQGAVVDGGPVVAVGDDIVGQAEGAVVFDGPSGSVVESEVVDGCGNAGIDLDAGAVGEFGVGQVDGDGVVAVDGDAMRVG